MPQVVMQTSPQMELVSPFPPAALGAAWRWHRWAQTCINGRDYTSRQFYNLMHEALTCPQTLSWGLQLGDEVVGIVLFTPIWRGQHQCDGSIHICLARKAWGRVELDALVSEMIRQGFNKVPTLTRMTAFTPDGYRPSHRILEVQQFEKEGIMRDGARIRGVATDIAVFGLTRRKWEAINGRTV